MGDKETKKLLQSCAENLLNAVSRLENCPQVSSPVAPVAPVVPVVEEHRRLFGCRPPNNSRVSSSNSSSRNGMFIWSKLAQNLLEMYVRAFARIKEVIWDQLLLLLLRLKLSRVKLYFRFSCIPGIAIYHYLARCNKFILDLFPE